MPPTHNFNCPSGAFHSDGDLLSSMSYAITNVFILKTLATASPANVVQFNGMASSLVDDFAESLMEGSM
jgi:hypothetical protein